MDIPAVDLKLTTAGKSLRAKIEAGSGTIPLNITRIVTGSGTSSDPLNLTAVVDEQQEFTITGRLTNGGRTTINATITNVGLSTAYSIYQIGFYAMDPDMGEILYRISQFPNPNYMPLPTERGLTYSPSFNFITGNASEVTVNIDPAGIATLQAIYKSVEMSSNETPAVGVRTHYYIVKDAPNYQPAEPPSGGGTIPDATP